jgi:hypothetical protein
MSDYNDPHNQIRNLPRLTNELFNRLALFGQKDQSELDPFDQAPESSSSKTKSPSKDPLLERYSIPLEYLIRLFAQSIILNAFVSRNFPYGPIRTEIKSIVELHLELFCKKKSFSASHSSQFIRELLDRIIEDIGNLTQSLDNWDRKSRSTEEVKWLEDDYKHFLGEYQRFVKDLNKYYDSIEEPLKDLKDGARINQKLVTICLKLIEDEHILGNYSARVFYEYNQIKHAKLFIRHRKIKSVPSKDQRTTIETLTNRYERYILFTFSPQDFLVKQFTLLAFRFFHEYISHLDASMYPAENEDGSPIEDKDRIDAHTVIPIEFKEGWMMHTAETFFRENASILLGETRRHLQEDIQMAIGNWISNVIDPDSDSGAYIELADRGKDLAGRFLRFLRDDVCKGNEAKAKRLYYRLSFDLIVRYPINGFSHAAFLHSLDIMLRDTNSLKLSQLIQSKCLRMQEDIEIIDLNILWSQIQHRQPQEVTLSNPLEYIQEMN